MNTIAQAQIDKIVDLYMVNNSVLETAKATGISTVKARKILITEGLWKSTTSEEIGTLLKQGMTTEEIADDLHMSVKNVQAYMPYERGVYGGEMLSGEANAPKPLTPTVIPSWIRSTASEIEIIFAIEMLLI